MNGLIDRINNSIRPAILMSAYWVLFWLFNGFDKFFNGKMQPMIEDGLAKGVLVNNRGDIESTLYGFEINGMFGVNRDAKTVTFFERIGIPEDVSLFMLYSVAVLEILLAGLFLAGLFAWVLKKPVYAACISLAYKLSFLLFMVFCVTDILIGERIELWEHNTFLLVLLVSYFGFVFRDKIQDGIASARN